MAQQTFQTDHLALTCFLVAHQQPLLRTLSTDRTSHKGTPLRVFEFTRTQATEVLVREFWNNAMIPVQDYVTAQKTVRKFRQQEEQEEEEALDATRNA